MQFRYLVYGLNIATDTPLSGLPVADSFGAPPDIAIAYSTLQPPGLDGEVIYTSSFLDVTGAPCLRAWRRDGLFRLLYSDGPEFRVDTGTGSIHAYCPPERSPDEISYYLLGPVLGLVLRYRGVLCLHACAVRLGDAAIAVTGPVRSGKSTTAAAFISRGASIISEDLVPLCEHDGVFRAYPGYPRIRLWPDSVATLFGSPDALPRLMPDWEKRYLELADSGAFCPEPVPLAAIYVLGERSSDGDAPTIHAVSPRETIYTLAANTYSNYLLDGPARELEFRSLARLSTTVPVRRVTPHSDPSRIGQLCDLITRDCSALREAAARDSRAHVEPRR